MTSAPARPARVARTNEKAGPAALAPESAARFYARPGIVCRPVTGISPTRVGIAWNPADDGNPVVRDFVSCSVKAGS